MSLPSYAMNQASFPEMYEAYLVNPLFRPWAEITLDEVELTAGDRVLDIACGTGIVARVAKERLGGNGRVVGVDISSDMLAVARAVARNIDWREGNAVALPIHDGEQFDVVVCQQGLQFIPDKAAAVAQMRRALARGGRLAVATWRSDDEIPLFRELRRVAERHLGPIADQRYSFGDASSLEKLLRTAGLHNVRVSTKWRIIHFDDGAPFLRLNTMAFVGMSAVGRGMGEQERNRLVAAIVSDSAPVLQSYSDASGLAFELSTNLATAEG
jgi:ubiquinone/menaquinone biosynthesis C-methylase UbiE